MSDFPQKVMVWHSDPSLNHTGTWSTTRYPDEAVAYAPVDEAMREAVGLACALHRRHYQDDAPQWEPLDTVAGVISQIDNMTAGMADEITALRARLEAVEKERDRLAEINKNLCQSHNHLLVDGSNWQRCAERAEAQVTDLTAKLATARRDALEEAASLNGWWLVMNAHGEPDGTYCSVQPSDEPNAVKYISTAAIRTIIAQEDAERD